MHDGVVVLNEALEEAKKRKIASIFFKIDFVKAYDSVEWSFLEDMMKLINFDAKWIKWIMKCVNNNSQCSSKRKPFGRT